MLLFITLFVCVSTILAPFYPLQDCVAHGRNAEFMGFPGWKKYFMATEYLLFFIDCAPQSIKNWPSAPSLARMAV
ncbi:hypothetical protein NSA36_07970 [Anaerotruncus colihominis]|nr:hypothetical protein [Anaerotruncus colihominis]